jgi:NAD(P)-dependent dehydrogenase (short-subunit alcohol dehydrogenase family)
MSNAQKGTGQKIRVFITGSADGLGHAAAKTLLAQGHDIVVHVRSQSRLPAVKELVDQGAVVTIGDLSDLAQIRDLASQANAIGAMDAVIMPVSFPVLSYWWSMLSHRICSRR